MEESPYIHDPSPGSTRLEMSDLGVSIRKVLTVAFGGAVIATGVYIAYKVSGVAYEFISL